eukprot:CAMPEP_0197444670 /NCGR_PEP_ID=MMETSP1175-20131217/10095_1 /TAXON_ID=1003142 /ORGANISM="Triceratium dubium, Strain CCMP147" /LENGTH=42 /DNA_ID= /DNA_START= /DNA_END= /DNA_ORIENTATION=
MSVDDSGGDQLPRSQDSSSRGAKKRKGNAANGKENRPSSSQD